MTPKIIFLYLGIYLAFTIAGISLAIEFWWIDGYESSFFNREVMILLGAAGLCWIGILHFSLLLTRLFYVKTEFEGYIGLFGFTAGEQLAAKVGTRRAKMVRTVHAIISFALFIVTVALFVSSMSAYKNHQLENNSLSQIVVIEDIKYTIKGIPFARFSWKYQGKTHEAHLQSGSLKKGDTAVIVFSKKNPDIVDFSRPISPPAN